MPTCQRYYLKKCHPPPPLLSPRLLRLFVVSLPLIASFASHCALFGWLLHCCAASCHCILKHCHVMLCCITSSPFVSSCCLISSRLVSLQHLIVALISFCVAPALFGWLPHFCITSRCCVPFRILSLCLIVTSCHRITSLSCILARCHVPLHCASSPRFIKLVVAISALSFYDVDANAIIACSSADNDTIIACSSADNDGDAAAATIVAHSFPLPLPPNATVPHPSPNPTAVLPFLFDC